MYLAADTPWLKTDAQLDCALCGRLDPGASANPLRVVYMAMRRVGKGELIAASQESFLLNETIKTHPNPVLLDFLAGGRPVIWVDETLHGLRQEQGVLWLVQRYRLQAALLLFWATLLAVLWSHERRFGAASAARLERGESSAMAKRWRGGATPASAEYCGRAGCGGMLGAVRPSLATGCEGN